MATDWSGQVALVTGAGRGIGRAVAVDLSSRGLRVALTSRGRDDLEQTAKACPGETLIVPADLTEPSAVEQVFDRGRGRLGAGGRPGGECRGRCLRACAQDHR